MSGQSNIIRSLLKVIGVMTFTLLITNAVFSDNRIRAGGQVAAISAQQPMISYNVGAQPTARDATSSKSNDSSVEFEPLLLLLFGLLLFAVATGIKLKLWGR